MKSTVAITLIISGALLILAPIIADQFYQARLANLMTRPEIRSISIDGKTSELYRFGCWAAGCFMIGLAVRFSVGKYRDDRTVSNAAQLASVNA